eukprot:3223723-Rhodomonas_salina.1
MIPPSSSSLGSTQYSSPQTAAVQSSTRILGALGEIALQYAALQLPSSAQIPFSLDLFALTSTIRGTSIRNHAAAMDENSDSDLQQPTKFVNLPGSFSEGAVHKWREHYCESMLGGMPKSWTLNVCDKAEAVKDSRAGHSADGGCNEDEAEGTGDGKRPVTVTAVSSVRVLTVKTYKSGL